jgi:hypothetical protein
MLGSLLLHIVLVVGLLLTLWVSGTGRTTPRGIDTRIEKVALHIDAGDDDEPPTPIEPPDPPAPAPPTPAPAPLPSSVRADSQPAAREPIVAAIPATLSPESLGLIRRRAGNDASPANPAVDAHVVPAGGLGTPPALAVAPLHGSLKPGQSIVYVLDCSGSMGEYGRLARAKAVLMATLERQRTGVRYQVVLYNSVAWYVFRGGLVGAKDENLAICERHFMQLEARGRSNHAEAVRMAANLQPDLIVMLTDAHDLPVARLGSIVTQTAGKPVPLHVAHVVPGGVEPPKQLR